jgi:hypothetical protein
VRDLPIPSWPLIRTRSSSAATPSFTGRLPVRPESGFELHHLVKTKEPKLIVTPMSPMTPEQIRRLVRIMESYVRGIEAEDFVPSPGHALLLVRLLRGVPEVERLIA